MCLGFMNIILMWEDKNLKSMANREGPSSALYELSAGLDVEQHLAA